MRLSQPILLIVDSQKIYACLTILNYLFKVMLLLRCYRLGQTCLPGIVGGQLEVKVEIRWPAPVSIKDKEAANVSLTRLIL